MPLAVTSAQDGNTTSGWPVVEHCLGETQAPPDDRTYEGTILLLKDGPGGTLHGINAGWETPRTLVFFKYPSSGNGALSPDQRWYIKPYGSCDPGPNIGGPMRLWCHFTSLIMYSTVNFRETYETPWDYNLFMMGWGLTDRQIRWLDNKHVIFVMEQGRNVVLNPFSGEITSWEWHEIDPLFAFDHWFVPASDWSRAIIKGDALPGSFETTWGVYDPMNGEQLAELPLPDFMTVAAWTPDSMSFAVEAVRDSETDDPHYTLDWFDRDGNHLDTLFSLPDEIRLEELVWSAGSRYLAFRTRERLYIADFDQQRIIDTCITAASGLAWSPGSDQLALRPMQRRNIPVHVYDLERDQLYTVGYHTARIIGWRAD